ncbi:MAG: 16S rRNA (guanine(527)-N(7))-methyltransferase RsmG [Oscillospiraceae bacterium]
MIDKSRLIHKAACLDIDITHCIDALDAYAELLVDYNKKVNLTAITDQEGIENKHFIDSLIFASRKEIAGSLVDVGTGAGFPGVVTKLFRPEINLTLMEPTGKRVDFLKFLCKELGIKADIVKERAEEAARKEWREKYDIATARAVASLSALSEYCLPLVKKGGMFIALKGDASEEILNAKGAIAKLGGEFIRTESFTLPDNSQRSLVYVKKISQTLPTYPRNGGKIAKSPLM